MPAKPSLQLLRSLTDEHVLRALMAHRTLTRSEIAERTGISKPTISESVRRLSAAGLLVDTGERTTGRGRAGSYYSLDPGCGAALVVVIRSSGVLAQAVDPFGAVVAEARQALPRSLGRGAVARVLRRAVGTVRERVAALRCATVSVAGPVDRATGRLVRLPDAPFPIGALDPVAVLQGHVDGPVLVDNDVNWAARAERDAGGTGEWDDFGYLYLGEGLGCAIVADGEVRRGSHGLAGEIAHLISVSPDGSAMPLMEVFGRLGLYRTGSSAINTDAVLEAVGSGDAGADRVLHVLARAVCAALSAMIALADPSVAVIGGSWGSDPAVVQAIRQEMAGAARTLPIRAAGVADAELAGARATAICDLQDRIAGDAQAGRKARRA